LGSFGLDLMVKLHMFINNYLIIGLSEIFTEINVPIFVFYNVSLMMY